VDFFKSIPPFICVPCGTYFVPLLHISFPRYAYFDISAVARTSSTINPPAMEQREGVARGQLVAGHRWAWFEAGKCLTHTILYITFGADSHLGWYGTLLGVESPLSFPDMRHV
jgi:hypothetical protein